MKRENEIQELKSANETVVAEDQKKTLSMHLKQQLNRTKNDNSKRQEKLRHVILGKCRVSTGQQFVFSVCIVNNRCTKSWGSVVSH